MTVIRAFIAIELTEVIQHKLEQVSGQLSRRLAGLPLRWAPVGNIHLTLVFLGDVSLTNLPLVQSELQAEITQHAPFEISIANLGVFPSPSRPRVIWLGVQAPPDLAAVQSGVELRMKRLGYSNEDRGFTPHLTLGRVARTASQSEIHRIGEGLQGFEVDLLGVVPVNHVHLFRSDLKPTGAVYTRVYSIPLNGSTTGG